MKKLTEHEFLILLLDFLDEEFLTIRFLDFIEKKGYTEQEITKSDPR